MRKPQIKGFRKREFLRPAVTIVSKVFEQAADTEFADVLFGCFGWNFQFFSN